MDGIIILIVVVAIIMCIIGVKIYKSGPVDWLEDRVEAANKEGKHSPFAEYNRILDEREQEMKDRGL